MVVCNECGGTNFTPHDGFFYCNICQTQSQDLRQIEMSFRANTTYGVMKKTCKAKTQKQKVKTRRDRLGDGPVWTSWQAFNFILKGMTEELIAIGAPPELEKLVLQIWACYLRVNEVAFTSKISPKVPKLSFPFRYRDGKILYNVDTYNKVTARRQKTRYLFLSKKKDKKYKLKYSKRKMNITDYEAHLSEIETKQDNNITLENLAAPDAKPKAEKLKIPTWRQMSRRGQKKKMNSENVKYNPKNMLHRQTLLTILHLALTTLHSPIQLSDLLRFIREGHLSYTGLSHFLPEELKFGIVDSHYIVCEMDQTLPTHAHQRHELYLLSQMLKFQSMPMPDLVQLLRRFALDLLLPQQVVEMAVALLNERGWDDLVTRRGLVRYQVMPSFELLAIAPILVVLKLLFGLDGVTERNSSLIADALNSLPGNTVRYFSWCQWQRAIECRNTVLCVYHHPTKELLDPYSVYGCDNAYKFLKSIHKDPYIRKRYGATASDGFCHFSRELVKECEDILEALEEPQMEESFPNFRPSLNPGISMLQDLIAWFETTGKPDPPWKDILIQNWPSFKIDYLLDPEPHLTKLHQNGHSIKELPYDWLKKHTNRAAWVHDKLDRLTEGEQANQIEIVMEKKDDVVCTKKTFLRRGPRRRQQRREELAVRSDHYYWQLTPSQEDAWRATPWPYAYFNDEVMPQFSTSWSWLLQHCSAMLHISTRDIYVDVLACEEDLMRMTHADLTFIK